MANSSLETLRSIAEEIRDASSQGVNDASKVGGLLVSIVDLLGNDTGLATFLNSLNNSSALNNIPPDDGQTIVYNSGNWGFGDAGGGGGSFPAGSVLASLSQFGNSPGTPSTTNCVIKWTNAGWVFAEESGTGGDISSCLTKTAYAASKFWGQSPTLTSGANPHYEVTGPLSGGITFIQFSNGVKLGVDSATDTIKVYKTVSGTEPDTTVDTGVAHFYATGGVSALGNSPGGGGGGGGDTLNNLLSTLNDSGISSAFPDSNVNNKALMWGDEGGETKHWYWGSVGSGAVLSGWADFFNGKTKDPTPTSGYLYVNGTSVTLAAGTSGISAIQVNSNAFASAGDSINLVAGSNVTLTANTSTTPKTLTISASGGGGGGGGTSSVTINGSSTGDYWAPTSAGTQGYLLTSSGNGTAPTWSSFSSLLGSRTLWGNTDSFGDIGTVSSPANLEHVASIYMANNNNIFCKNASGVYKSVLTLNLNNTLALGYQTRQMGYQIDIQGDPITFTTNSNHQGDTDDSHLLSVGEFTKEGQFYIKQGTQGLRIGNGLITWEEASGSFKIERLDANNNHIAGHLYATGGISALGLSSGSSPSIGNLTVTDLLTVAGNAADSTAKGLLFKNETLNKQNKIYMDSDGNINVTGGFIFGSGVYGNSAGFHSDKFYLISGSNDASSTYIYFDDSAGFFRLSVNGSLHNISTSPVNP